MKRWNTGSNCYYFTSSIYLDEAPWYIFFIEHAIQWICHYFPRIPLPPIKIKRYGEETTLRAYYGTAGDLFHVYVCTPVFNWCWENTERQSIEFPYKMIEELFPDAHSDDCDYFNDEEDEEEKKIILKNIEYSKSIGEEFRTVYNKLQKIADVRSNEIKWSDKNESKG